MFVEIKILESSLDVCCMIFFPCHDAVSMFMKIFSLHKYSHSTMTKENI